jgi:hypothetical protein
MAAAVILAAWLVQAAPGQTPDTRLIDDKPRMDVGAPPGVDPAVDPRSHRRIPEEVARTDRDRIDLDLDLKERREKRGDGESTASSMVAALVFVAAGAALLLLLAWVWRRGGR